MNNTQFDFNVDKSRQTVTIDMEFPAALSLVWDAFTKKELIDQWYAPKPMMSRTKDMNFEVGGRRFFAMVTPEGQERWLLQTYKSISPKTHIKFYNAFADADANPELPGSEWDLNFTESVGSTKVNISIYNESLERLERQVEMGFQQGMMATLTLLSELLERLSREQETK